MRAYTRNICTLQKERERERERERQHCAVHSKREVGGVEGWAKRRNRFEPHTHTERERDETELNWLLAASCLIHYLKADHGKRHLNKSREKSSAKNTTYYPREREIEWNRFDLFTFRSGLIRRVPAERDFRQK